MPPCSEVVIGRSKLLCKPGYGSHRIRAFGRPRGDADAYLVDNLMICRPAAPWPGCVGAVPLARLGETKNLDGQGRQVNHVIKLISTDY